MSQYFAWDCRKDSRKITIDYGAIPSINCEKLIVIKIDNNVSFKESLCKIVAWMFHSRKLNARISRPYERALGVAYRDFSLFEDLERKGNCTTLYRRNIQKIMRGIFKVEIRIAPELMKDILRNQFKYNIPCTYETRHWKTWHWSGTFYRFKTTGQSSYRDKKFQIPWRIWSANKKMGSSRLSLEDLQNVR